MEASVSNREWHDDQNAGARSEAGRWAPASTAGKKPPASEPLTIGDTVVVEWTPGQPMVAQVVNVDSQTGTVEVSYVKMEPVTRKSWCAVNTVRRVK
jgi:hypothetical protein